SFDLHLVAPQLPDWDTPDGHDEMSWLRELTLARAVRRSAPPDAHRALGAYGPRHAERVRGAYKQLAYELDMIAQLDFPGYFLIVSEIVDFCTESGILCQGRGSAANSAVCYALGIPAVDPVTYGLLFERFLAPDRDGPPDIDLDI